MENKLNEILELCIQKSNRDIFYEFRYRTDLNVLIITTFDNQSNTVKDKTAYGIEILNQALDYILNE